VLIFDGVLGYNSDMTFIETHGLVKYGRRNLPKTGICELCNAVAPPATVFDHCHLHGWIRGEICIRHNLLLASCPEPWMAEYPRHCPGCPPLQIIPAPWLR
jgi:hypothetical protein